MRLTGHNPVANLYAGDFATHAREQSPSCYPRPTADSRARPEPGPHLHSCRDPSRFQGGDLGLDPNIFRFQIVRIKGVFLHAKIPRTV